MTGRKIEGLDLERMRLAGLTKHISTQSCEEQIRSEKKMYAYTSNVT